MQAGGAAQGVGTIPGRRRLKALLVAGRGRLGGRGGVGACGVGGPSREERGWDVLLRPQGGSWFRSHPRRCG